MYASTSARLPWLLAIFRPGRTVVADQRRERIDTPLRDRCRLLGGRAPADGDHAALFGAPRFVDRLQHRGDRVTITVPRRRHQQR